MTMNEDVEKGDFPIYSFLPSEFYARVYAIKALVEGFCWVHEGVV